MERVGLLIAVLDNITALLHNIISWQVRYALHVGDLVLVSW